MRPDAARGNRRGKSRVSEVRLNETLQTVHEDLGLVGREP